MHSFQNFIVRLIPNHPPPLETRIWKLVVRALLVTGKFICAFKTKIFLLVIRTFGVSKPVWVTGPKRAGGERERGVKHARNQRNRSNSGKLTRSIWCKNQVNLMYLKLPEFSYSLR